MKRTPATLDPDDLEAGESLRYFKGDGFTKNGDMMAVGNLVVGDPRLSDPIAAAIGPMGAIGAIGGMKAMDEREDETEDERMVGNSRMVVEAIPMGSGVERFWRWFTLLTLAWFLAVMLFFPIRKILENVFGEGVNPGSALSALIRSRVHAALGAIGSEGMGSEGMNGLLSQSIGDIGRNQPGSPFNKQYQSFKSPYPVYVISLEEKGKDPKRGAHRRLGTIAKIVPGIQIPDGLHSRMSERMKKVMPTPDYIGGDVWNNWTRSSPGQIACHFAHLNARKQAYDDGHPYVVILEDDTSTNLAPTWPMPLDELVKYADRRFPKWTAIRLSWWLNYLNFFERRWSPALHRELTSRARSNLIAARKAKLGGQELGKELGKTVEDRINNNDIRIEVGRITANLDRTIGKWTANVPVPLLSASSSGYSGAAVLINRKGLEDYLRHYAENGTIVPPGALQTYDCEGRACRNDINWRVFSQEGGMSLIATPPYFVPSMSDASHMAAIDRQQKKKQASNGYKARTRSDNHVYHVLESSFAIFWAQTLRQLHDFERYFYAKRQRSQFRQYHYWTPVTTKFNNVTWIGSQARRPYRP